ncbi:MAG TPA: hypothetical protein VJB99_04070 [Patescibacteria group bacterium]|nr:hypothetical protein [Patescibacteria group bacterium]
MPLSKYIAVFRHAWQQQLEYRFDTFMRVAIALVSFVSVLYLWGMPVRLKTQ